jgi:hypothetical protein
MSDIMMSSQAAVKMRQVGSGEDREAGKAAGAIELEIPAVYREDSSDLFPFRDADQGCVGEVQDQDGVRSML